MRLHGVTTVAKPPRSLATAAAALTAAATLAAGMAVGDTVPSAVPAHAATPAGATVVTLNPWYQNGPFDGWGTSLAWFANATGSYGDQQNYLADGTPADAELNAKANENGAKLRQNFYDSIFGEDGLNLNMARYNIGGGNASDVAYGYPFMRQGANVPGYWKDDPDGTGVYRDADGTGKAVTTKQKDKDRLDAAFDPDDDAHYDWSKGKSQEWWLRQGTQTGDIDHWEAFANSAPWFMTEDGYVSGGINDSWKNNLRDPEKFAQYLATVVRHLEDEYGMNFDTVEPFNESESGSWATPGNRANQFTDVSTPDGELVQRYLSREFRDKGVDPSLTPYLNGYVKKPQEGMHVDSNKDNPVQQRTVKALAQALAGNEETIIAATDAQFRDQFMEAYLNYSTDDLARVGQYNVHGYGGDVTYNNRNVRDVAQRDGKKLSMSEVDGSWQSGGFNPFGFDNALGFTSMINNYVYQLQSKDFNFWQVVEDLYNMQEGTVDDQGRPLNPGGENTNWGTVFIDFDCTVTDADGNLYSRRRVDDNGGTTKGLSPCSVLVNSKYNAMRAYTQFIGEGDSIIANSATGTNFSAVSADGRTTTVVHTNSSTRPQTYVIDLSNFQTVDADAAGTLYLTTASDQKDKEQGPNAATPEVLGRTSNVRQPDGAVTIDAKAKTATMTVPARSIASVQLTGLHGVADSAPNVEDGHSYTLVGQQSSLTATAGDDGALTLRTAADDADGAARQVLTFHELPALKERPTLHRYTITTRDGRVLATDGRLASAGTPTDGSDPTTIWILNTEDGENFTLVNAQAAKSLQASGSAEGSTLGLGLSNGSAAQGWRIRGAEVTGHRSIAVRLPVGGNPADALPGTVVPYYTWGAGDPVAVSAWDVSGVDAAVKGTYQATAKATDVYGNVFDVTATVYVGDLTAADPASILVKAGATAEDVRAQAPATVPARVGDSKPVDAAVSWEWPDDFAARLSTAQPGDRLTIPGALVEAPSVQATLTVYVSTPETTNIAPDLPRPNLSYQDSTDVNNTFNGDLTDKGWTSWSPNGTVTPVTADFYINPVRPVDEVRIHYYRDGRASWPQTVTLSYWSDAAGAWLPFGEPQTLPDEDGEAPVADIKVDEPVEGSWIKITNDLGSHPYISVSEIEIMSPSGSLMPASDAALGALRIDGTGIDGFDPDKDSYEVSLPAGTEDYPTVQALARDTQADVEVTQASADNDGTATVTVTPADGNRSKARTITVHFDLPRLVGLSVKADSLTYRVGDDFDLAGLTVTAQYRNGKGETKSVAVKADDPQLNVSPTHFATAGKQTVTVSYRGVSATFTVTVTAVEEQPGPKPVPEPTPGETHGGTKPGAGNGNGSGADTGNGGQNSAAHLSATGSAVVAPAGAALTLLLAALAVTAILRRRER